MFRWMSGFLFIIGFLQAKPLSMQVSAPSAILINADTGAILYEKESHLRALPASITKIATALYVLEQKGEELDARVEASQHALISVPSHIRLAPGSKHPPYRLEHDGTSIGLKPGEKVPLLSLLYGLMLSSGNDAANVLAEFVSGSADHFCIELNAYLKSHGIVETHFSNPHGLHHPDHWTTAYDMAQITRLALRHPTFREIVKTSRYFKPETNLQPAQYFVQKNKLLQPGPYFYPKAIGVKIGYHMRAGFTLVAAATHEGRTLIAVLLKCQNRNDSFPDAIKLFDAAFSQKKVTRTLYVKESESFSCTLHGVAHPLKAVLKEDIILEYYPAEELPLQAEIIWNDKMTTRLPISIGDQVGYLQCIDNKGNVLIKKPVFAMNEVSLGFWASLQNFFKEHKTISLAFVLGAQVIIFLIYLFKKHQKIRQR